MLTKSLKVIDTIESCPVNAVIDGMSVTDASVKYYIDEEWINDKVDRERSRLLIMRKKGKRNSLRNNDRF